MSNCISTKMKGVIATLMVVLLGVFPASAEDKKPAVDRLDPGAVAKAFIVALANERFDEAVEFVILEDREDFKEEILKGVPKLPKKPEVVVRLEKDGKRASTKCVPKSGAHFSLRACFSLRLTRIR